MIDRGFKLVLRTALVLVILAGVILVVQAYVTEADKPVQAPEAAAPAAVAAPRPAPAGPAAAPSAAGGAADTKKPPEPQAADTPKDGAQTTDDDDQDSGPSAPPDLQSRIMDFTSILRDKTTNRQEATVKGQSFVLNNKTKLHEIVDPIVIALLAGTADQGVDIRLGDKVRLTADRAELDENHRVVRLFDNVIVKGSDFTMSGDSVTYTSSDQSLASDTRVRIEKDRLGPAGEPVPELMITGTGLSAELQIQKMVILSDVETRLLNPSEDFLAGGPSVGAAPAPPSNVIITSKGKMVYEHLASKATFADSVRATASGKALCCDQLTILLARNESTKKVGVSDIIAAGNVALTSQDQVAHGDRLEWRNVTETGALTGEACTVETLDFQLKGKELTFFKMNNRFHAEGPGSLLWKAAKRPQSGLQPELPAQGLDLGPLRLKQGEPILISWQQSMTHDVPARLAVFKGQVVAAQGPSSLACQNLELNLGQNGSQIDSIVGTGGVTIHDQMEGAPRDVVCDKLVWHARDGAVDLQAAEGQTVNITAGRNSVSSAHILLNNQSDTVECQAPGRLTTEPSQRSDYAGQLSGQTAGQAAGQAEPIRVEWQKMMYFEGKGSPLARFAGSVVAQRGDEQIRGEALRVTFDPRMSPTRITATGNASVVIQSKAPGEITTMQSAAGTPSPLPGLPAVQAGRWTLSCDELNIFPPEQSLTSTTPGVLQVEGQDAAQGSVKWQKSVRLDFAKNFAEFLGQVDANFSGSVLKGERVRLDFDTDRNLNHVWADGNIYFTTVQQGAWELKSTSAEAIFAPNNVLSQIIARDRVQVHDQTRTLTAQLLQLFLQQASSSEPPALARAVAQNDVHVNYQEKQEKVEGGGDRLEWTRDTDTYVFTGDPYAYFRRGLLKVMNGEIRMDRQTGAGTLPPGAHPLQTILGPTE